MCIKKSTTQSIGLYVMCQDVIETLTFYSGSEYNSTDIPITVLPCNSFTQSFYTYTIPTCTNRMIITASLCACLHVCPYMLINVQVAYRDELKQASGADDGSDNDADNGTLQQEEKAKTAEEIEEGIQDEIKNLRLKVRACMCELLSYL